MLVQYGGGITDARGSIGGQTHSRNRYGAYVRARTTPVNPRSARQMAARAKLSQAAAAWRLDCSQANRDAWDVFGANVPATNKLGAVINLTGYGQFVKSNTVALNAGIPLILTGPAIMNLPGQDPAFAAAIDAGTGLITLTFDDALDWCDDDGGALIVQMGLPQSAQIGFFDGPWRGAGVIEGDSVEPPTTPDSSLSVPFEVADGQKVWVRAKILRADGRLSDWFQSTTTVASA